MGLEFNQILPQVERLGRYLAFRDSEEILARALGLMDTLASDMGLVRDRIAMVRDRDVSGYRGAAPLDGDLAEALHLSFAPPPLPAQATLVAVDGSQVYPDYNASSLYYLTNISTFVYRYGDVDALPNQHTVVRLEYTDALLYDADQRLISNRTVNNRRTVQEFEALWERVHHERGPGHPLVALHDGNLLKFFSSSEVVDSDDLLRRFFGTLRGLADADALLAGYVDKPRSSYMVTLLHLLRLEPGQVHDVMLRTNGDLEGLTDAQLYARVLRPGHRSALMVQNSPQNLEFKRKHTGYEVACFYINTSEGGRAHLARVDVPMWVARDKAAVGVLHTLLLHQCRIQGRNPYPYALTRADELAYVSGKEKGQVEDLVRTELLINNVAPQEASAKLSTKDLARGDTRGEHRLNGGWG